MLPLFPLSFKNQEEREAQKAAAASALAVIVQKLQVTGDNATGWPMDIGVGVNEKKFTYTKDLIDAE